MYVLTFLIFEVQQKRGVENARKRRPNLGKNFKFKKFDSSGRGTGNTRITIFAYGDLMLKRWPLDDHSAADCQKESRALEKNSHVWATFTHSFHPSFLLHLESEES